MFFLFFYIIYIYIYFSYAVSEITRLDVVVGMHYLSDPGAVRKKVIRIIRHNRYNSTTMMNDIAILVLSSPINFNEKVRPVCLPSSDDDIDVSPGKESVVIGWGHLKEGTYGSIIT